METDPVPFVMSKKFLLPFVIIVVATGILAGLLLPIRSGHPRRAHPNTVATNLPSNRHSMAQAGGASNNAADVVMKRFEDIVMDLTNRGETNTLAQIMGLLAAKEALAQTRDASVTVALLQRLRMGRTNEVIEVMEIYLDGALGALGNDPQEVGEAQIKALKMAKEYREKYPRAQKEEVTRAFELLPKE